MAISSTNIKAYNMHTYSLTGLLTGKTLKTAETKGIWLDTGEKETVVLL